MSIFA